MAKWYPQFFPGPRLLQYIARKLIRLFGTVTPKDIENEERALKKLRHSNHRNIIHIIAHGWLRNFETQKRMSFYTIDMEVCGLNLGQYIEANFQKRPVKGISEIEIWGVLQQLASGLRYL